jgi:predicted enzyme related to lactoylglutathione lyase
VPLPVRNVVVDCNYLEDMTAFWQSITGYDVDAKDDGAVRLVDPAGAGPALLLQRVPELRTTKNRLHLDLAAADLEAAAAEAESLGARRLRSFTGPDDDWIVLVDPEGNQFCVVQV